MKALILILLAATYAEAQTPTLADYARQERARRAQSTGAKVYTIKSATPAPAEAPAADAATAAPGTAPAAGAAPPQAGVAPTPGAQPAGAQPAQPAGAPAAELGKPDPAQQWAEETEKLRTRIRQLADQETTTQLEINTITNRIYAPVTSVPERDRAQAELGLVQGRLSSIREELTRARLELQVREKDGPPKK